MSKALLKHIPKVDVVLTCPPVEALVAQYSRGEVLAAIRDALQVLRGGVISGEVTALPDFEAVAFGTALEQRVLQRRRTRLRGVINATGVILHTNLGRAPLSTAAIEAIGNAARGYSNLEFDLETGERGSRHDHVAALLCELTGAEAALVVNNCAAAVLVALAALAGPSSSVDAREVVVSRGELIEIGGAFRMPDVIAGSGATMVEVGTTNKTHLADYQSAMGEQTGALLTTHPSNYRVLGFTAKPTLEELVTLANSAGVPLVEDLGSGMLVDAEATFGIREPSVQHSVGSGVDVVTFSGDKLLGGPQAGIIVGKQRWLQTIRKHPLMRAMRIDKLSLAALEATLQAYRPERDPVSELPVLRMLATESEVLRQRSQAFAARLEAIDGLSVSLCEGAGYAGGGTLPMNELPAALIALERAECSAQTLQEKLRAGAVPVIGRIVDDRVVLDLRTVSDVDLDALFETVATTGAAH